jgi:hypothetical protein
VFQELVCTELLAKGTPGVAHFATPGVPTAGLDRFASGTPGDAAKSAATSGVPCPQMEFLPCRGRLLHSIGECAGLQLQLLRSQ